MKTCAVCHRVFDDRYDLCPFDNSKLPTSDLESGGPPGDEPITQASVWDSEGKPIGARDPATSQTQPNRAARSADRDVPEPTRRLKVAEEPEPTRRLNAPGPTLSHRPNSESGTSRRWLWIFAALAAGAILYGAKNRLNKNAELPPPAPPSSRTPETLNDPGVTPLSPGNTVPKGDRDNLLSIVTDTGSTFQGLEVRSTAGLPRKEWRCRLKFESYNSRSGAVTGQIEWPDNHAIHRIEGALSGAELRFRETGYIKRGSAELGLEYELSSPEPGLLKGKWSNANSRYGTFEVRRQNPR